MVDLDARQKKVMQFLKESGATSAGSMKKAEVISDKTNLAKGLCSGILDNLKSKGLVERVRGEKVSGYYITQAGINALTA